MIPVVMEADWLGSPLSLGLLQLVASDTSAASVEE